MTTRHKLIAADDSEAEAAYASAEALAPGLGNIMRTGFKLGDEFMLANPALKAGLLFAWAPGLGGRAMMSHLLFPASMKGSDKRIHLQALITHMAMALGELVNIASDEDSELFKDRVLQ